MRSKDLLSVSDLSGENIRRLISNAVDMKAEGWTSLLSGKVLALLFEKPSTRTRVSFQRGMFQLGGNSIYLDSDRSQISRGESLGDTARILSSYSDGIVVRVYDHSTLFEFVENSNVPVINALSDIEHPCQTIADLFTIYENKGGFDNMKF